MKNLRRQRQKTNRRRILVVDGDRDMQRQLNSTLGSEGFDTIAAGDGAAARHLFQATHPDLVILDTAIPGQDSFQLLGDMRGQSDIPIIMLTEDYGEQALWRAFSLGADDYVRKPFGARSLVARVRAKLRRCQTKCM